MEEEKKIKSVIVEFFGIEKFVDAQTSDGDGLDAHSGMSVYEDHPYELTFSINGKEYGKDDFGEETELLSPEQSAEFKDENLNGFFEQTDGCEIGMLYTNKASGEISIELDGDEEFDPKKACLIIRKFIYKTESAISILSGFAYAGKVYRPVVEWSNGKSGDKIWEAPSEDSIITVKEPTEEMKAILEGDDFQELPFLFFRSSQIGCYYECEDNEVRLDCYDWMDEEGLMVVYSPYEKADGFVSRGIIWDMLTNLEEEKYENDFTWCEMDIFVTEGFVLFNSGNNENIEDTALDAIEAVWSKSAPFSSSTPAMDPLLIRQLTHTRNKYADEDEDDEDEDEKKDDKVISDYILCKGKLCQLPDHTLDRYFDRDTEMNLFSFDQDPETLRKNTLMIDSYKRLLNLDAGKDEL